MENINLLDVMQELHEIKAALSQQKEVLTSEEAAGLLGISKGYLYTLTSQNKLPYYKGGGGKKMYFKRVDMENWMCMHKIPTNDEINESIILR